MSVTIGKKLSELRKERGITQEKMAEVCSVSPQAVSKWENDLSCPDITLLPQIAELLGVTVDELLSDKPRSTVTLVPKENRKSPDELMLKLHVTSDDDTTVNINLPLALIKMGWDNGIDLTGMMGKANLPNIDLQKILELVEKGVVGKLMEIKSDDTSVEIIIELRCTRRKERRKSVKLSIKSEEKNICLRLPSALVFSDLTAALGYRKIGGLIQNTEKEISREQVKDLFREIRRLRRLHPDWTLLHVKSETDEIILRP